VEIILFKDDLLEYVLIVKTKSIMKIEKKEMKLIKSLIVKFVIKKLE